ncbi:MAG: AAA family ATPase [Burkholderiales bacterium]|nr:AAA family ATPase [Burkholderiales bacterium]
MYAAYFGLKQAPFSIAPDPRYLFMSERHREALAHLLYGVGGGGGFVLLTGEIGAGKTTVCRCFLEQIPRRCNVAYIFNPKLSTHELLQAICDEFRIPVPHAPGEAPSLKAHVDALNEYLLKTHAVGQNNVLIIDEAQNLSAEVLEQLRLLTNLETSERKLLQIMLIGQPELRQVLARPELEQMAQRVIARFHLDALTEAETAQYIQHRLNTAGLRRGTLFDSAAVKRVHLLSKGVPRRINLLCDRALLGAYAEGKPKVDKRIVDKAAAEVFEGQAGMPLADKRTEASPPPRPGDTGWLANTGSWAGARSWPRWAWALFGLGTAISVSGLGLAAWSRWSPEAVAARDLARQVAAPALAASAPSASDVAAAAAKAARAVAPDEVAEPSLSDAVGVMRAATRDEAQAWHDLASLWPQGKELAAGEPCAQARRVDLICFRNSGGLSLLTQLDRPALLVLQDGSGAPRHAVLTRVQGAHAWLKMGETRLRVPLSVLSGLWRGDFATLWLAPPGYKAKVQQGQSGPVVDWLAGKLAGLAGERLETGAPSDTPSTTPGRFDAELLRRLQAFQLSQGLKPDGVAGATTFMLINRATEVDEPRLMPPAAKP